MKAGGGAGPAIVAGKPAESVLVENITGKAPAMPPNGPPLGADEVALISTRIAQGAIDASHPPTYAAPPGSKAAG